MTGGYPPARNKLDVAHLFNIQSPEIKILKKSSTWWKKHLSPMKHWKLILFWKLPRTIPMLIRKLNLSHLSQVITIIMSLWNLTLTRISPILIHTLNFAEQDEIHSSPEIEDKKGQEGSEETLAHEAEVWWWNSMEGKCSNATFPFDPGFDNYFLFQAAADEECAKITRVTKIK